MSKHFARSLPLAKRIVCNENEALAPAPPPPRFARFASSSGPPPPLSRGRMREGILTTRSASEFYPWRGANWESPLRYPPPATCFFLPSAKRGGRTPTDAGHQPPRLRTARARRSAHACRRSTAALTSGNISSRRLGFRPGFLGLGLNGRYPPSPVPVQGCTSHPGHNAGRLIPKPPGSGLQIRPRAPHPLHLTACLRKASLGEQDVRLKNDTETVVKCGRWMGRCETL